MLRTVLISYGVAVSGYLFTQSVPAGAMQVAGGLLLPRSLVVLGLVSQVLLIGARRSSGIMLRIPAWPHRGCLS